jgi:hypothetical protein
MGHKVRVNGFKLQQRIRELSDMRDVYGRQFTDGRFRFEDEKKRTPDEAMQLLNETERKIVELQLVQAEFNMTVKVDVDGREVPLMFAVKMVGALGRMGKMWRVASKGNEDRYRYNQFEMERERDKDYAVPALTMDEYAARAREAGARAAKYREAIALGNATILEMDVDPGLFE